MTASTAALQTRGTNLYSRDRPRSLRPCLRQPMDEPRVDSTSELLQRAQSGDNDAIDVLFARHLPSLRRWASGRLPRWSRDLMDTDDLVQETIIRTLKRIDGFESRHEGALQAYLRQAMAALNRKMAMKKGFRWGAVFGVLCSPWVTDRKCGK